MKKTVLFLVLFLSTLLNAQNTRGIFGETNWLKNWTNFKPKSTEYRETTTILEGVLSEDKILRKSETYLLKGNVYLSNGATLFIEPGTLIRGDFESNACLIITKGAKILAIGEDVNPIVFTSNKPASERKSGDWGGIIIMGDAPINKFSGQLPFQLEPAFNQYGGNNLESYSGILKYVRIEFAGKKGGHSKNLNGLSLAGIGKKTILEEVQISFSADDSFEFYGGNVMTQNLISYRAIDDDFDFTEGVQCKISNSIAIRNSFVSSPEGSRAIEMDSYDIASNVDLTKKVTTVEATNLTLVNDNNENSGIINEAIYIKEKTKLKFKNSIITGFKNGVIFGGSINENEVVEAFQMENILFNYCETLYRKEDAKYALFIDNLYQDKGHLIESDTIETNKIFRESDLKKIPDFRTISTEMVAAKSSN